jgi:integrase
VALTDTWLKSPDKKGRTYEKSDGNGLSVRVSAKGKIVFQLRYRYPKGGKPSRLDLGTYPDLSLSKARKLNAKIKEGIAEGVHPKITQEKNLFGEGRYSTFSDLFLDWYEQEGVKKKASRNVKATKQHVLSEMGGYPASQISTARWMDFFEKHMPLRPYMTGVMLSFLKQVYFRGISKRVVNENPLAHLSARRDLKIVRKKRKRVLSDDELIYILKALTLGRSAAKTKIQVLLCLYYGCRIGELTNSHPKQFDFNTGLWTLLPEEHKTGEFMDLPLVRPITKFSKPLIVQALSLSGSKEFVFTNITKPDKFSDKAKGQSHLNIPKNINTYILKNFNVKMVHWTIHDLRRTARTNWTKEIKGEKITLPHVAEIMLGHSTPGVEDVYDLNSYLPDQARAYNKWGERIEELLNSPLPERKLDNSSTDTRTVDKDGGVVW